MLIAAPLARSAARSARSRGRRRDGVGRRGDLGDPRDPHRGQRAGRRRACRCSSRTPMPPRRRGSNATASTSSASPGSSGSSAVEAVPAGGVAAVVEGTTLILRVGDVIDLGKEKARLAQGDRPARRRPRRNSPASSATRPFSPRPSPRWSRSSASAKPTRAATATGCKPSTTASAGEAAASRRMLRDHGIRRQCRRVAGLPVLCLRAATAGLEYAAGPGISPAISPNLSTTVVLWSGETAAGFHAQFNLRENARCRFAAIQPAAKTAQL